MARTHPSTQTRLVVVVCPQWPVVAVGCRPDEPIAVLYANRVIARSRAAAAAGVRIGQRRREAQGRCPDLRIVARDPAGEARAFHSVVDAVAEVVPRLELTAPGTLTFAARGPSRYFGGDDVVAAMIAERIETALGHSIAATGRVGVGVADGRFAAGVAARLGSRAGRPEVIERGGSPRFLADLPVGLLSDVGGLGADQVELFRRLGLGRLGAIAAIPEPDVLARFGPVGVIARTMASGLDDRPFGAEAPPEGLAVVHRFEPPVQHLDAVVFTGRTLAERIVGTLAADGRVCTQFAVIAETEQGERCERLWSLSAGFSVATMVERVRWQLDGWGQSGWGQTGPRPAGPRQTGVVQLHLEPTEVRADDGMQLGLWGGRTQADDWAQRAATRLAGLVGDAQVVVPEWRGGRQPVDQYRWVPASSSSCFEAGASRTNRHDPVVGVSSTPSAATVPWPGRLPAPSPAVVYPSAAAVSVFDAAGAAVTVSARGGLSGEPVMLRHGPGDDRAESIVAWAGPWLLDERWWDPERHRRVARFQVLTAAGCAYLATVERQQWWVVAEYS